MKEIALTDEPSTTRRANLPVSPSGISNREVRPRTVLPGPMPAIDWLCPSARGDTFVPSGSRSWTLSAVNAVPPAKLPVYVTS